MISTTLRRADQLLVQSGLVRSRTEAQRLIENGQVIARDGAGRRLQIKPATRLDPTVQFELPPDLERFVSRGALKLQAAVDAFSLTVSGHRCLDAGQSTGGFTECLLLNGAAIVVGVDVGHGQLDNTLALDPRVVCVERFNLRDATHESLGKAIQLAKKIAPDLPQPGIDDCNPCNTKLPGTRFQTTHFQTIVADLSFISIRKVLPALASLMQSNGQMVVLVKPQFELGPGAVNKHGVVRDPHAGSTLKDVIAADAKNLKLALSGWISCPITGGDGNQEYLAWLTSYQQETKS
ncbi:MAG: TlyA family RNA methyltransferase [Burkholderiaceae bacterium]